MNDALDRAIEIIRNRVDQFGVTEPLIARQGDHWIVVQLPGIKDPERAKELIGKTALLEFHMVDDTGVLSTLSTALTEKKMTLTEFMDLQQKGQLTKELTKLVPAGYEILPGQRKPLCRREVHAGVDRLDSRGRQGRARAANTAIPPCRSNLILKEPSFLPRRPKPTWGRTWRSFWMAPCSRRR